MFFDKNIAKLDRYVTFIRMNPALETLPDTPAELKQIIIGLCDQHERQVDVYVEQIRHLRQLLFGRRSEKMPVDTDTVQLPLFDMPEPEQIEPIKVTVDAHARKKPGRKPLPPELPRVEVVIDLPEDEKVCGCGCTLSRIVSVKTTASTTPPPMMS